MELIGTSAAAEILGVNWKTVKRWAIDGDTDGLKLPIAAREARGALYFEEAAVRAYRDQRIAAQRARLDEIEAAS